MAGNLIGTNSSGTAPLGNGDIGVLIQYGAADNWIGVNSVHGPSSASQGNVIAGNAYAGVVIQIAGTTGNVVAGNLIGTNSSGTAPLGNGTVGILIQSGAADNWIGVNSVDGLASADQGNVIAGSSAAGVDIDDSGTTGNVVAGNLIGLNVNSNGQVIDGLGDGYTGVQLINGASGNWIGVNSAAGPGTESALERNVISGNFVGVTIDSAGSDGNVVAGNLIGTDPTGTTAVPNQSYDAPYSYGVDIDLGASSNLIGTSGQDGADDALERNVISGNTLAGVYIFELYNGEGCRPREMSSPAITSARTKRARPRSRTATAYRSTSGPRTIGSASTRSTVPEDRDEGNVISGNTNAGVLISDSGTTGNVIAGNLIGLNVNSSGQVINGLGDGPEGVELTNGASGNWIGVNSAAGPGTENALQRNVISGSYIGVVMYESGTDGNVVAGNLIGTDPSGTTIVPNQTYDVPLSYGVVIAIGASSNLIGTSGQDGADDAVERNVISGVTQIGVYIYELSNGVGAPTTGNVVAGDYIGTNETGTASLANGFGVVISLGAANNWVGVNPVYGAQDREKATSSRAMRARGS